VCWCASRACDVRHSDGDMLTIVLVASSAMMTTASGLAANSPTPFWVTKILSDALDDYVPDGGTACRRHGLQYREGLAGLRLWATRSKTIGYTSPRCTVIERTQIDTPFSVHFRPTVFRALRTTTRHQRRIYFLFFSIFFFHMNSLRGQGPRELCFRPNASCYSTVSFAS